MTDENADNTEQTTSQQTEPPAGNGRPVRSQGRYVALDATKLAEAVVDLGSEPKTLEELTAAVEAKVQGSGEDIALITGILKDKFSKKIEVVVDRESLR